MKPAPGAEPALALIAPEPAEWEGAQAFRQRVEHSVHRCAQLWLATEPTAFLLEPGVMPEEQARREAETERRIGQLRAILRRYPTGQPKRTAWRADLLTAARQMAVDCLGFPEAGLNLLFTDAGLEATRQFLRQARAFAPAMNDEGLFQALRNFWVINCVQLFLDHNLVTTPAGLAYSMLYPCTDNYLDDPQVSTESKARFGQWLDSRLRGAVLTPSNSRAEQVSLLIGKIEDCFPRSEHEEVYLSLWAIHRAQMRSLLQHEPQGILDDNSLLRVTMEKGGTSVLANAYLVKGWLSKEEAEFMFALGVLLQLMDDLQDLQDDLGRRHNTLFTRQVEAGLLDEPVARLWSFMRVVLGCSPRFAGAHSEALKRLIHENCRSLMLRAVARHHHFCSRGFLAELESRSPFGFEFLQRRERTALDECRETLNSLRAKHRLGSVFDLIAGAA